MAVVSPMSISKGGCNHGEILWRQQQKESRFGLESNNGPNTRMLQIQIKSIEK